MRFGSVYTKPFSPEIKVVVEKASAAIRPKVTILNRTMQISRQNSNRIQIDVVSPFTGQMKPYRFENALLLAFSLRSRSVPCNRIENDAVTNETTFV